jgi:colanic acid biosynthesis glycosyl transferase WcaI
MKLILVNRYFFPDESATSRMLTSLARSLSEIGWCVCVLTSRNLHNDPCVRLPACETVDGVKVHRVKTTAFGRAWLPGRTIDYATFHIATMWHLLRLARRGDLCIVCTDPPLISVTATLPVRLRRSVLVNWLHDLFPEIALELGIGGRRGATAKAALWLRDYSVRRAAINIAPIRRMTAYLRTRGIPPDALVTIAHWSDGDAIRPIDPSRNALREEWGLTDRFVVGYSGNFGRAHDFSTFLDAAQRLQDCGHIVFTFIGGGHQKGAVEAAVAERRLSNIVLKPLQPRERLAEALSVADLHLISLLPSLERFIVPSKLYGILAAGRPAAFIGDPSGEIATVLRDGNCGRSVPLGDSQGLVQMVLELAGDPALRDRLGRNARATFEAHYTEARGTAGWQLVLGAIARSAPVPAAASADD